jgi:pimeloyl-ACP methyl ester carboxylesterase
VRPGETESFLHRTIALPGLDIHTVEAGPADGPLVLLLHGFPEFWYGWRRQIRPLADAGFHVVAPDQRGYNLSGKPPRLRDYRVDHMAQDAADLIKTHGHESAFVVGHDWGAGVAWWLALARPERVRGLVILNGPHPQAMIRALLRRGRQRRMSWYMLFFQLPWISEALWRRHDLRDFAEGLARAARPGTFSKEDLQAYRDAWSRPGALTGMLNWYRALRFAPPRPSSWRVQPPTLVLWGAQDAYLELSLAQASADLCRNARVVVIDQATHWVHLEESEKVNQELVRFFGRSPQPAGQATG